MQKLLVIATFNSNKVDEIRLILPDLPFGLKALADFPGAAPAEEDGATLEENALKKALAAARFTGQWALADDTGLEVDALGGAPGVFSARYSGVNATAAENNARLLTELSGVPLAGRTAHFTCVMALACPDGRTKVSRGTLGGRIALAARGGNGFGYDPLFEITDSGRTLAELSGAEKNGFSHRALALRGLLPELRKL